MLLLAACVSTSLTLALQSFSLSLLLRASPPPADRTAFDCHSLSKLLSVGLSPYLTRARCVILCKAGSNDTNEAGAGANDTNEAGAGANDTNEAGAGANDTNEARAGANDTNESAETPGMQRLKNGWAKTREKVKSDDFPKRNGAWYRQQAQPLCPRFQGDLCVTKDAQVDIPQSLCLPLTSNDADSLFLHLTLNDADFESLC